MSDTTEARFAAHVLVAFAAILTALAVVVTAHAVDSTWTPTSAEVISDVYVAGGSAWAEVRSAEGIQETFPASPQWRRGQLVEAFTNGSRLLPMEPWQAPFGAAAFAIAAAVCLVVAKVLRNRARRYEMAGRYADGWHTDLEADRYDAVHIVPLSVPAGPQGRHLQLVDNDPAFYDWAVDDLADSVAH
jgi:hypothetical protein